MHPILNYSLTSMSFCIDFVQQYPNLSISITVILFIANKWLGLFSVVSLFAIHQLAKLKDRKQKQMMLKINQTLELEDIIKDKQLAQRYCQFAKFYKMIDLGFEFIGNTNLICQTENVVHNSPSKNSLPVYHNFTILCEFCQNLFDSLVSFGLFDRNEAEIRVNKTSSKTISMRQILDFSKVISRIFDMLLQSHSRIALFISNPLYTQKYTLIFKITNQLIPKISNLRHFLNKIISEQAEYLQSFDNHADLKEVIQLLIGEGQVQGDKQIIKPYSQLYEKRQKQGNKDEVINKCDEIFQLMPFTKQVAQNQKQRSNEQSRLQEFKEKQLFMRNLDNLLKKGLQRKKYEDGLALDRQIQYQQLPQILITTRIKHETIIFE